jgi:hypothetical protein
LPAVEVAVALEDDRVGDVRHCEGVYQGSRS